MGKVKGRKCWCPHCEDYLQLRTFNRHRDKFYNKAEKTWKTQISLQIDKLYDKKYRSESEDSFMPTNPVLIQEQTGL